MLHVQRRVRHAADGVGEIGRREGRGKETKAKTSGAQSVVGQQMGSCAVG